MVHAQLHGGIEILHAGHALLQAADGVQTVGHEEQVDDEARVVLLRHHDALVQALPEGAQRLVGAIRGLQAANDFQEGHHRHRVEEVSPDHLVGPVRGRRDLGDGDGGGVGSQDTVPGTDLVETAEDLMLGIQVLQHRLDHQVAGSEVLKIRRAPHPVQGLGMLRLAQLTARQALVQRLPEAAQAGMQGLLAHLADHHLEAGSGADLHDAGTHEAAADHTDGLNLGNALIVHGTGWYSALRRRQAAAPRGASVGAARPAAYA